MPWQDLSFMLGSIVLTLTLVPTLLDSEASVPRWTSIPTACVLFWFTVTYLSMNFLLSATVSFLTGLAWTGIAVWRY